MSDIHLAITAILVVIYICLAYGFLKYYFRYKDSLIKITKLKESYEEHMDVRKWKEERIFSEYISVCIEVEELKHKLSSEKEKYKKLRIDTANIIEYNKIKKEK